MKKSKYLFLLTFKFPQYRVQLFDKLDKLRGIMRRGQKQDGSGKGQSQEGGRGLNRNTKPCKSDGPGRGQRQGKGKGKNR